jgi:transcriptional regulator with XRE-family HTH domain
MPNFDAMSTFSFNVNRILRDRGLSHAWLAEQLEMERTHLSRALRGANSPRLCFVESIAKQLKVDIRDLFEPISEKVAC